MTNLNINGLSEEFNIDNASNEEIINITPLTDNPDEIIMNNINNANIVLDRIITEINNGNFSARMAEVAGQLVNSVTAAVEKIYIKGFNIDTLQIKKDMVYLKKKELEIKSFNQKKSKQPNEKLIITDRETILKMLKDKEAQKMLNLPNEKGTNNDE